MEFKEITKVNICKTTGLQFADLLEKKPVVDARLSLLQRQQASINEDFLARGNPQLTLGQVTVLEDVDMYFREKEKSELRE